MPAIERVQAWLPWCAGLVVGFLALPFVWSLESVRLADLILIAIALSGLGWTSLSTLRKSGKYDLGALKNLDEREELRRIQEEEPLADSDQVLCVGCGEVYEGRIGVCPRCGRT